MNDECNFSRWIVQFLYPFRRLAGVELGNPSTPDLCVYKTVTSTNVHAPRSVLYDWKNVFVRPEAFTPVTMKIIVFWDVTKCSLAEIYQCFRGMFCLHLQGRRVLCCLCSNTCCKEDLNTIGTPSIIVRQSSLLPFSTYSGFICTYLFRDCPYILVPAGVYFNISSGGPPLCIPLTWQMHLFL
jgi:hypothetical protein